jgi:antitoxin CptB
MLSDDELSRLKWRSRRGLLENDLMLEKFYAVKGNWLDSIKLESLNELLALGDNDLWDLLSGRAQANDPLNLALTIGAREMLQAVRAA